MKCMWDVPLLSMDRPCRVRGASIECKLVACRVYLGRTRVRVCVGRLWVVRELPVEFTLGAHGLSVIHP